MEETRFTRAIAEGLSPYNIAEQLAALTTGYTPDLQSEQQEPTYYDRPVLKTPLWRWEIIWYFFFGGLAAGCYIIATIASFFGSREDRAVVRAGYYASLLALLPCPFLLIKDLGRPERFLNMLRMFKVRSPMSMGTWALLGLGLVSGITATIQAARDGLLGRWWGARLLTATSVPLWSRSKLLGAVFISSAMSTSSALISLLLRLSNAPARTLHKLERLEWVALLTEMAGILAFLRGSGRTARPLVGTGPGEHGMTFWRFVFGTGLVVPWLLQTLSLLRRSSQRRAGSGLLISVLVLVGGYLLRRTFIEAGRTSSSDARTTLWNAKK